MIEKVAVTVVKFRSLNSLSGLGQTFDTFAAARRAELEYRLCEGTGASDQRVGEAYEAQQRMLDRLLDKWSVVTKIMELRDRDIRQITDTVPAPSEPPSMYMER